MTVKVNGKARKMSMFEANVRALAHSGIKDRVAAQRFIDLATDTSERHLERSRLTLALRDYYDQLERENAAFRERAQGEIGSVVTVPWDGSGSWPPEGVIDDEGHLNVARVRELQEEDRRRREAERAPPDAGKDQLK